MLSATKRNNKMTDFGMVSKEKFLKEHPNLNNKKKLLNNKNLLSYVYIYIYN